jgi:hypothetical protein
VTGSSAHRKEPIDRWLADRQHDLHDGLGRFLDHDAGLREAMLHTEHDDVLGALGSRLDTEAGLAAILPPPAAATPQAQWSPPRRESGLPDMAAAIADLDPAVRIALRRNPVILAVILSDLLVRALAVANAVADALNRDLNRDLGLVRALDRDINRARGRGLGLNRERDHVSVLARDLELARDLANDLHHDRNLELARDLAHDLYRDLVNVLSFDRTRDLNRDLARDLNRERDLEHTLARDLNRDLNRDGALALAHHVALTVGRALGVRHVDGLAAALLDGVMDDFTRADLSRVDLTGLDLTGMRWSDSGTVWPVGTDVDELRARSKQVDSGIYVIASPSDGIKSRRRFAPR